MIRQSQQAKCINAKRCTDAESDKPTGKCSMWHSCITLIRDWRKMKKTHLCLAVCVCAVLGRASGPQADGLASCQLPVPCQHPVCHVCAHQPDGLHLVVHCWKRRSRSFLAHRSRWAYYALPLVITKSIVDAAWKLRHLALIGRARDLKTADKARLFWSQ